MLKNTALRVAFLCAATGALSCKDPAEPLVPAAMEAAWSAPAAAVAGSAIAPKPSVIVTSTNGKPVPGVEVTFELSLGGGSITGATQTTDANGHAEIGGWVLGPTVGLNSVRATAPELPTVLFSVTSVAGPAASIAPLAGDSQSGAIGGTLAIAPSVKVTDANGNAVGGVAVTFLVTGGGGSITGANATTNSSGVAAVGSWTLGSESTNTLAASAAGLTGSPVTFTATAATFFVSTISPALLTPGVTATIAGGGFSATAGQNAVTVDGVTATVTAATPTQLTISVPANMPCEPSRNAPVAVSVGDSTVTKSHPVQAAKQRALTPGQLLIISDPSEVRCNELSSTSGRYLVNVYNTNTTYSPSGAAFQLRGAGGLASSSAVRAPAAPQPRFPVTSEDLAREAIHDRLLAENIRILNERGAGLYAQLSSRARSQRPAVKASVQAGDQMALRVPNLNFTNFCQNFFEITGRVVYAGTRAIIVEDNANPMAGTIDSTYFALGAEFDQTLFPILEANFGNPLAMDGVTDQNGRLVMVFTRAVNDNMSNLGGFVVTCDFFPRTTFAQSNFGEYFYARVPTVPGTLNPLSTANPPGWRWTMRSTIIHEAKHITSFGERISRNASSFEASWLEESTARISEELYERSTYGFTQKSNIGYGSASDQRGPYCDVRVRFDGPCLGKPRGIYRIFEDLWEDWYPAPETHSPLGRTSSNDFSFYNTGWSLVRWSIDHSSLSEAAFLKGLTQETSRSGLASIEARTGRAFADMLPEWTFAMALDDYPGFTPALSRLSMPSWDLRSVFAGLNADFPNTYTSAWPFVAQQRPFGSWTVDSQVFPGTASFVEIFGVQSAKQLLELKTSSGANAPSELKLAIVRIQ